MRSPLITIDEGLTLDDVNCCTGESIQHLILSGLLARQSKGSVSDGRQARECKAQSWTNRESLSGGVCSFLKSSDVLLRGFEASQSADEEAALAFGIQELSH